MNYLTAHFALEERGGLREGETVLVHGAAGGVGTATLQVAKGLGARTIAVVSTEEKAEFARAAGADEAVLSTGFKDAVTALTDGAGVDVVLDVVGGDVFTDSLRCLAGRAGCWSSASPRGQGIPEVKVNRLLLNNVDVRGVGWGAYAMVRPGYMQRAVGRPAADDRVGCRQAADRGDVRPGRTSAGRWPTWTSGGPWASRSSSALTLGALRRPRAGSGPRDDPRRRPRRHGPRHPAAGRPLRTRQRPLAGRDRDPGRPVELGRLRRARRHRRAAGARRSSRSSPTVRPTSPRRGRAQDRRPLRLLHGRAHRRPGLGPVRPLLDAVDGAARRARPRGVPRRVRAVGGHGLFGSYVDTDDARLRPLPGQPRCRAGSGLPDESYYRDDKFAEVREKYVAYLTALLALAEHDDPAARGRDRPGGRDPAGRGPLGARRDPRRPEDLQPDRRPTSSRSSARPSTGTPTSPTSAATEETLRRDLRAAAVVPRAPLDGARRGADRDWRAWLLHVRVLRAAAPYLPDDVRRDQLRLLRPHPQRHPGAARPLEARRRVRRGRHRRGRRPGVRRAPLPAARQGR